MKVQGTVVRLSEQSVEQLSNRVKKIGQSGILTCGENVEEAKDLLCKLSHRKHVVLTNSGTSAFDALFAILRMKGKKRVAFQANQFPSVLFSALRSNFEIVFLDLDFDRLVPDVSSLDDSDWNDLDVLVIQMTGGFLPDVSDLLEKCRKYNVMVIEDGCHSLGANGKTIFDYGCCIGDVSVSSFFATKMVACGEGGALFTDHDDLAENVEMFVRCGKKQMWGEPECLMQGMSSRLSELNAAGLCESLISLQGRITKRVKVRSMYFELFSIESLNRDWSNDRSNLYKMPVQFKNRIGSKEKFYRFMKERDIIFGAGVFDSLVMRHPCLADFHAVKGDIWSITKGIEFARTHVCLPLHEFMTEGEVDWVVKSLKECGLC